MTRPSLLRCALRPYRSTLSEPAAELTMTRCSFFDSAFRWLDVIIVDDLIVISFWRNFLGRFFVEGLFL